MIDDKFLPLAQVLIPITHGGFPACDLSSFPGTLLSWTDLFIGRSPIDVPAVYPAKLGNSLKPTFSHLRSQQQQRSLLLEMFIDCIHSTLREQPSAAWLAILYPQLDSNIHLYPFTAELFKCLLPSLLGSRITQVFTTKLFSLFKECCGHSESNWRHYFLWWWRTRPCLAQMAHSCFSNRFQIWGRRSIQE